MRTEGLVHKIPVETLLKILQLVAPPHTRAGLYDLSELTHVCRFWRMALINQPRVWSSIFVTFGERRDFVEMCLERSRPAALDVTVDVVGEGPVDPECTCGKDQRGRLLPNERDPCKCHFVFESLATPVHSKRIHTLNIDFHPSDGPFEEIAELSLGSCRFFHSSFPQLTDLRWDGLWLNYPIYLFPNSPFTPTVRSLSFAGSWDGLFTQVKNLTSLVFTNYEDELCIETFRLFMSNNRSLESLSLDIIPFDGNTKGPPVDLPNLQSFCVRLCPRVLSAIIRVPSIQRLSSLRVSYKGVTPGAIRLLTTGDGITLELIAFARNIPEAWDDLVGYGRPTIRHVRLCDFPDELDGSVASVAFPLLADAHTLEVGRGYLTLWYQNFLDDLKQLRPQLKTVRFEVWEEVEPFGEGDYEDEMYGHDLLDSVEELVRYRFENGHPFSVVERMVVCESERSNRQQDYVWRCFYNHRKLGQYVRPV